MTATCATRFPDVVILMLLHPLRRAARRDNDPALVVNFHQPGGRISSAASASSRTTVQIPMPHQLPEPRYSADDLGQPIPDSPHAVSVCLPLWEHNVGYEEGDASVIDRMQAGYPRFFVNPLVADLFRECERRFAGDGKRCVALPTRRAAERCGAYVRRHGGNVRRVDRFDSSCDVFVVTVAADSWETARQFWQHAGEIVSSRAAERLLAGQNAVISNSPEKELLRERVAGFTGAEADDVFLFPSGMAAIYAAWRTTQVANRGRPSVQFGFPYVDTLKLLQRFSLEGDGDAVGDRSSAAKLRTSTGDGANGDDGERFFPQGNKADLSRLAEMAATDTVSGLFCEFPGNPLLMSPDLSRLREIADQHGFPLVVDDTLGAMINTNVLPVADMVTSSLTKFFSGAGDVIAGSLVLNRTGPHYPALRSALREQYEDLFFDVDAAVLAQNSTDVEARVRRINATAETLCEMLHAHPAVDRVYYPKYVTPELYRRFGCLAGGWGGLFSIDLHDPDRTAPAVYDALRISKGPNLGTNFSLCCPFTILAHYDELDFAESCGVSRYLLRVSVGLEDPDWLIARFEEALAAGE